MTTLPKPGDRDYVAGQPIDEEEAKKTEDAEKARLEAGQKAVREAEARAKAQPPQAAPPPASSQPAHSPPKK